MINTYVMFDRLLLVYSKNKKGRKCKIMHFYGKKYVRDLFIYLKGCFFGDKSS